MARRVHVEEHENHERWLVSYADFITLLFSFFVVMYAISTLSESKYKVLSDSLVQAFRHDRVVTAQSTGLAPINRTTQAPTRRNPRPADTLRYHQEQKLLGIAAQITDALRALMQAGQVKLTQLPHGLAVEINASVLFAPAQATIQPEVIGSLTNVAHTLAGIDNVIHIEGHTDNLPINTPLYPSNWELSGARASSVVRLFAANGVAPARLRAVGFADNKPIASNDTADGRQHNRRVTLLILADQPDGADANPPARDETIAAPSDAAMANGAASPAATISSAALLPAAAMADTRTPVRASGGT
ncbi:MAG TPA: flagellar motor protein MotD [Casimicrobiaceae bacterium]